MSNNNNYYHNNNLNHIDNLNNNNNNNNNNVPPAGILNSIQSSEFSQEVAEEAEDQQGASEYEQMYLTPEQLRTQANNVFGLAINPVLVMLVLSSAGIECSKLTYLSDFWQILFCSVSVGLLVLATISYGILFGLSIQTSTYKLSRFHFLNYSLMGLIVIQLILFAIHTYLLGQAQDLRWTRMTLTLLILTQQAHAAIIKLYQQPDNTLSEIFNKIYFLVVPLSEHEKEQSYASFSEIYSKFTIINRPLPIIYFLLQMLFHLKMYHWSMITVSSASTASFLQPWEQNLDWMAISKDQLKCVQIFGLLIILGFLSLLGCTCQSFRINQHHVMRLPYIMLFLYYTVYIITYKLFLCTQLLSDKLDFEHILMPIFIVTVVPLASSIFAKRALARLYKLPSQGENEIEQQEKIDLFSNFKFLETSLQRGELRKQQDSLNSFIQLQQFSALLAIFFFCFVDIGQLMPPVYQPTVGFYLQNAFDILSGLLVYMSIVLCITSQGLFHVGEGLMNGSEFGAFSFLLFSMYLTRFLWTAIFLLSAFVLSAYFINFTDSSSHFHLGPVIALLLTTFLYITKYLFAKGPLMSFSNSVKEIALNGRNNQFNF